MQIIIYNILENEFYLFWGSIGQYAGCTFCLQVTDVFVATPPQHVCAFAHGFLCVYIYTNTRYRYAALYYIYNRIVIHAYISYIYISRAYKRYYWQSIVSASLYLHVQDRQGLSDIKGVVTAAFQHHSMHCCDTLGETWWAPRVMLRPIPGKMLGIAGVKKLKTGLPPLVNYIT